MSQFVLSCCSTADLTLEYITQREINLICFHYILDGVEYPDDLGQTVSFADFFQQIADGAAPTTSQITVGQYTASWEPLLAAGKDVLHLCLSSGITGTYESACQAQALLAEKYPERKLIVIDSLAASAGFGLVVDAAANLRDEGKSIDEVAAWLEENKLCAQHWFFVSDLACLIRGGRVSKASGILGSMLNICPLLNVDFEGRLIPRAKCRGKKGAIKEMLKRMEEHVENGKGYSGKVFISNSACQEDAETVAKLIEEQYPNMDGKVQITSIGTVIGAHTGPGTVALFFWGDKRID